jgi:hypothetical protein
MMLLSTGAYIRSFTMCGTTVAVPSTAQTAYGMTAASRQVAGVQWTTCSAAAAAITDEIQLCNCQWAASDIPQPVLHDKMLVKYNDDETMLSVWSKQRTTHSERLHTRCAGAVAVLSPQKTADTWWPAASA